MAKPTKSRYRVFFRKYGQKQKDGHYPVLEEKDRGTFLVDEEIDDPENELKKLAGNPPRGFSFDFSWEGDE